jgi:hypothetical protein
MTSKYETIAFDISCIKSRFDLIIANIFYGKISVETLIELFTSIPIEVQYNEIIWYKIEELLGPAEYENLNLEDAEIIIESLIENFYSELGVLIIPFCDPMDNYTFFKWIDRTSIMLINEKKVFS